jgi:hypothetical protein
MKMPIMVFQLLAAVAVVGCATRVQTGYVNEEALVFDRADSLTASERSRLVTEAVSRLLTDPMFTVRYSEKCKIRGNGKLPLVAIAPLENNVPDGRSDAAAMGQFSKELMVALRKTGKFDLLDDLANPALMNRITSGNNDGESASAAQSFGDYDPPDFYLTGDVRRFLDDGIYTHCLNLQMLDTSTRRVFWSDTAKILKRK